LYLTPNRNWWIGVWNGCGDDHNFSLGVAKIW